MPIASSTFRDDWTRDECPFDVWTREKRSELLVIGGIWDAAIQTLIVASSSSSSTSYWQFDSFIYCFNIEYLVILNFDSRLQETPESNSRIKCQRVKEAPPSSTSFWQFDSFIYCFNIEYLVILNFKTSRIPWMKLENKVSTCQRDEHMSLTKLSNRVDERSRPYFLRASQQSQMFSRTSTDPRNPRYIAYGKTSKIIRLFVRPTRDARI